MNAEYDRTSQNSRKNRSGGETGKPVLRHATLEKDIRARVTSIVRGENASDNFYGNLLDHITAYPTGAWRYI